MKYTKIKTFEDACKALKYEVANPAFSKAPKKHQKALAAHYKLVIVIEALNEGWQPDWDNTDEWKYELWPDVVKDDTKPSGFGLSYHGYVRWSTHTIVSSRLCFKDRERAKYCFDTFKQLWEDYFLIDK